MTRDEIRYRLRHGRLHLLYRAVYLVGHPTPAPLAREVGALIACGEHAVLSHRTAAGRKGARRLEEIVRGGPVVTRSEAERRFLAVLREAGLPRPETNQRLGALEVDALWRGEIDRRGRRLRLPRRPGGIRERPLA